MILWLRSALFLLWFGVVTTILSLVFVPVLVLPRGVTVWLARLWAHATFFGLKILPALTGKSGAFHPRARSWLRPSI